ncbi:MAG TPA: hypothetical protein VMX94_02545 [Armatimonadota bacterium]|nr:hypothetical protein [Armatimonadota bacterium]
MGQARKESNLIPTIALVVSIVSLVASAGISVLSFWYVNLNKGVVVFSKPNIVYVEHRQDERIVFGCPVTVTVLSRIQSTF